MADHTIPLGTLRAGPARFHRCHATVLSGPVEPFDATEEAAGWLDDLVAEVEQASRAGFREVVVHASFSTGINSPEDRVALPARSFTPAGRGRRPNARADRC